MCNYILNYVTFRKVVSNKFIPELKQGSIFYKQFFTVQNKDVSCIAK